MDFVMKALRLKQFHHSDLLSAPHQNKIHYKKAVVSLFLLVESSF